MVKVYIASPYTNGDQAENVKAQIDTAEDLICLGYAPFIPLLFHFQHLVHPHSYAVWLKQSREWLLRCNALLRLPGASVGADCEVKLADAFNIPVFHSIADLEKVYAQTKTS